MATSIVDIRDAIHDAIVLKQAAGLATPGEGFVTDNWDIEASYLPVTSIPELVAKAKIWILGGFWDTMKPKDRENTAERTYQVHIGIQHKLLIDDIEHQDEAIRLQEEIRDLIRKDLDFSDLGVQWLSDECLKDPNKLPYSYKAQREGGVFEQYFTVHFLAIV